MFPFGSVLTNIPLIVLAAAYLLYMGTTVFSRNNTAEEQEVCAGRSANIIMAEEKTVNTGNAFLIQLLPCAESGPACIEEEEEQRQIFYETHYRPLQLYADRIVALFTGNSIFSRPPPLA